MGILRRLFAARPRPLRVDAELPGPGEFAIEVVGESKFQDALERAAGGRTDESCEVMVEAVLVLEDSNPHDPKAVKVLIDGEVCGYLDRQNARAYRRQLKKAGHPKITASCQAMIVGGWDRGPRDRGYFGVRLDLPTS